MVRGLGQLLKPQGVQLCLQQHQPHQHGHAAQDGDGQIGLPRAHGGIILLMHHPAVAGEAEDLKE